MEVINDGALSLSLFLSCLQVQTLHLSIPCMVSGSNDWVIR